MVGAIIRAVASRVGLGGRRARDASSGRGPRARTQARDNCNKTKKYRKSNNPHHVRDRCICSYHVRYRTVRCKIPYGTVLVLYFAKNLLIRMFLTQGIERS